MAQIKNPEEGKQKGKVTIVGYSERFFMNATPPVYIRKDLLEIGKVEKNGKIEIEIDKESTIVFKCNQCVCRFSPCVVKPGDWVVLIYDRAADSMLSIITDEANHIRVREEYYKSERRKMLRALVIVLIMFGMAGGIYGGIHAKFVHDRNAKIEKQEHNRKVKLAKTLEDRGLFNIENPDAYTIEELERMQFGYDLLPFELREKVERNGDVNYSKSIMSNVDAENMREISYPADIPEIQEQAAVVRNAKKNFDIEFAKALDKLSAPAYQGIMAQKIFWEANDALDKLEIESRKLEILLRRNDFQEYAEQEREEREALKEKYRMVKRNLQR